MVTTDNFSEMCSETEKHIAFLATIQFVISQQVFCLLTAGENGYFDTTAGVWSKVQLKVMNREKEHFSSLL